MSHQRKGSGESRSPSNAGIAAGLTGLAENVRGNESLGDVLDNRFVDSLLREAADKLSEQGEGLRKELLRRIGEQETPINRAESAYRATKKAADDPYDDTGWAEPMTNAVIAAVECAFDEIEEVAYAQSSAFVPRSQRAEWARIRSLRALRALTQHSERIARLRERAAHFRLVDDGATADALDAEATQLEEALNSNTKDKS